MLDVKITYAIFVLVFCLQHGISRCTGKT